MWPSARLVVCTALSTSITASADLPVPQRNAARERALDFVRNQTQFHLGFLVTEQPHPKTHGLAEVLRTNTAAGLRMLLSVDDDLPPVARRAMRSVEFASLRNAMSGALDGGGTIVFSGCGATGRLAILLDAAWRRFWRKTFERHPHLRDAFARQADGTRSVMTGGDYALIRSVESFEDFISFGEQQIEELDIGAGDVLVAISEGGETSSVIGTALRGLARGARVFFVFNNPADLLAERLERSRRLIRDPAVTCIELCTGPMAVAGSTRMQATTIEMLVVGAALEAALTDHLARRNDDATRALCVAVPSLARTADPLHTLIRFEQLLGQLRSEANLAALARWVELESSIYARGGRITYFARDHLLDIFTDTTERSPTFKIPPFRPADDAVSPAPWAFVKDPLRATPDAWRQILEREPRCLEWTPELYARLGAPERLRAAPPRIGRAALYSYRIGNEPDPSRTEVQPNAALALLVGREVAIVDPQADAWLNAFRTATSPFESRWMITIGRPEPSVPDADQIHIDLATTESPLALDSHLAAKMALNAVSSATMGRLGRLVSNWMAHVDATNKKLLDRSTRLVAELAEVDYETACVALFETLEEMQAWDEVRRKTVSPAAYTVQRLRAGRPNAHPP
ncbi:MAG: sugar phosphate isomerase [Kiritimatiellae bacterium]|nr:sugar phosphate isomerase [Kiritimatiellia bacterium]